MQGCRVHCLALLTPAFLLCKYIIIITVVAMFLKIHNKIYHKKMVVSGVIACGKYKQKNQQMA